VLYDGLSNLLHFTVRHGVGIKLLLDGFLAALFKFFCHDGAEFGVQLKKEVNRARRIWEKVH
jgi:hypothetical protein